MIPRTIDALYVHNKTNLHGTFGYSVRHLKPILLFQKIKDYWEYLLWSLHVQKKRFAGVAPFAHFLEEAEWQRTLQ